jgi:hypothetical protein
MAEIKVVWLGIELILGLEFLRGKFREGEHT